MIVYVLFALMSNSPRQAQFQQEFKTQQECVAGAALLKKMASDHGLFFFNSTCIELSK
jgi:ribosomal protein L20A (L18A)